MLKSSLKNKQKIIKVALVGQPNVGKSMLLNSISNASLKIGNFPGVTVEKSQVEFKRGNYSFVAVDLPGTYSLNDFSPDEKVTKDYLANGEYDIIVNVIDATNLERNLYLTSELVALGKKMVIALNMIDETENEGISIDEKQISKNLGEVIVKTSAKTKVGIDSLINLIIEKYESVAPEPAAPLGALEQEISHISHLLQQKSSHKESISYRELAINLLVREDSKAGQEDNRATNKQLLTDHSMHIELQGELSQALDRIHSHYGNDSEDKKSLVDVMEDERDSFIKKVIANAIVQKTEDNDLTSKIDSLLIHKFFGIPIFLLLMWSLFQITFSVGDIVADEMDYLFVSLADATKGFLGNNEISYMISDGIIAGVGAVILFLPYIMILFFGITLLETTGYMSRVSFLMDGLLRRFGLHGKSFIPLISGFGCSIPAYMAARTLKSEKERMLTLFIIGFMSCSARTPIYVLFVGAFFEAKYAGSILFLIYIFGAILGLIGARILSTFAFKGKSDFFVMEMPKYRLPSLKTIWRGVSKSALMYLKKAGTLVLLVSILVWFAGNYPKNFEYIDSVNENIENASSQEEKDRLNSELSLYNLENSYLGKVGTFIEPLFRPLGYDWKMTIALATGLAAKEVVVSTLGVLYGLQDATEEDQGLIEKIRQNIHFAAAISFVVFVMIYLPCLAASMVFMKESGGVKYFSYLFVFTTVSAWFLSFVVYNFVKIFV